jgi:hypothetical protein
MLVCVAEVTGDFAVHAWICDQLGVLFRMTSQAFCFKLTFQNHVERLMWIVTTQTVVQGIMVTSFVALTTSRNIVCAHWAMASVAIKAIYLTFVSRSGRIDFAWFHFMTLATILNRQFGTGNCTPTDQYKNAEEQSYKNSLVGCAVLFHDSSR